MSQERNAPCACGSGKKYKKCCMLKDDGYNPDGTCAHPKKLWRVLLKDGMAFMSCGRCGFELAQQKLKKLRKDPPTTNGKGEQGYREGHKNDNL